MQDGANEPVAVPVPPRQEAAPPAGRRGALLFLGIGVGVGLLLGVLISTGVFATYTFFTHTLPETRDSVEVFNQLNELRLQVNQMNEEQKLKDQEKEDAMRQALRAVAERAQASQGGTPGADAPAKKAGGGPDVRVANKPQDGFAEIDEEIERLEQTQKVLNTILDVFSRKAKEAAKEPAKNR
jgi:hypothetical protein